MKRRGRCEGRIGSFIDSFEPLRFRATKVQILPDQIDISPRCSPPRSFRLSTTRQLPLSRGKKKILSTHFQLFASRAVEILPPLHRNTSHQAFYPSSIVRLPSGNEVHFTVNLCKFSCRMRDRNFYLDSEIGSKGVKLVIEGGNYFYLTSRRNIRNRYFQASLLFLKERSLSFDLPFLEINAY